MGELPACSESACWGICRRVRLLWQARAGVEGLKAITYWKLKRPSSASGARVLVEGPQGLLKLDTGGPLDQHGN